VNPAQPTLWLDGNQRIMTIDQTRLPFERVEIELSDPVVCAMAIRDMQVRGAPLIGVVAAFGLALAMSRSASDESLQSAYQMLLATRPTAVNLRWALDRVRARIQDQLPVRRALLAWHEANAIREEDIQCNRAIGEHALHLLRPLIERAKAGSRPLQLLTHCNAGALGTVAWGTALAPMFLLRQQGVDLHVWVDETRPRNQGASLTAWELGQAGIAHTLVADNAGGLLMMQGRVDAVLVGCDRVSANGDVCNKIGTYLKALAASAHRVPFYVACPRSSIDRQLASGDGIPIEERSEREVSHIRGVNSAGDVVEVRIIAEGVRCLNPAFDITPAALVSTLITERGACAADPAAIAALFAEA
jgi:methylthioribose-1-phosphate isomerase